MSLKKKEENKDNKENKEINEENNEIKEKEKEESISFKKKEETNILSPMSGSQVGEENQEDDLDNEKSNIFMLNEEIENLKNKLETFEQKLNTIEKNSKFNPNQLLGETGNNDDIKLIKLNQKSLEDKINEINKDKDDIWSLGCIIYELFNLNIYTKDKFMNEIKEINSDIYIYNWQKLIDSLLQIDYKKRFDINQVIKFLEDELNNKDSMENLGNKMNRMNLNNKNNIIIGEIYIKKEDINKDIRIIKSYENVKREKKRKDEIIYIVIYLVKVMIFKI